MLPRTGSYFLLQPAVRGFLRAAVVKREGDLLNFSFSKKTFWETKLRVRGGACPAASSACGVSSPLPSRQCQYADGRPLPSRCPHPAPQPGLPAAGALLVPCPPGRSSSRSAGEAGAGGKQVLAPPGLVSHLIWWRERTAFSRVNAFHRSETSRECFPPEAERGEEMGETSHFSWEVREMPE